MRFLRRHITLVLVVGIVLIVGGWLQLRVMQGPVLPAYRLVRQPLVQMVVATGRVASASRAQVGAQIGGVIEERRVQEGDQVKAGDVLAILRADELSARVGEADAALTELRTSNKPQADAVLQRAKVQLDQANRELARRRDLVQRGLIAQEVAEQAEQAQKIASAAYDQAELAAKSLAAGGAGELAASERLATARALQEKTLVRAQVDGIVLTRDAEPGDVVQPGKVLFELARAGQTELLVPVDEKNLAVLQLDQRAQCVTDAYPDRPFPATVSFIAPAVDPQRGSVDIRLRLSPVPDFLRQDMTVSVNVETNRRDNAVVVPNDALHAIAGSSALVWKVDAGHLERASVIIGLRGLAMTEITDGLDQGDMVLADFDDTLRDGDRVRVREEAPAGQSFDRDTAGDLPVNFD